MIRPGWYPDPRGQGERWHDGTRWTGVTRHSPASAELAARAEQVADRQQRRTTRRPRVRSVGATVLVLTMTLGLAVLIQPDEMATLAHAVGIDRPHRLLPAVTPATRSANYAFLHTGSGREPVTYDPCKPVHYVINPAGAPADYLTFIGAAVAKAQAASGLQFSYDGLSTETWSEHAHAKKAEPVLISFPTTLDGQKEHGDAVGLGGSAYLESNRGRPGHYVTGQIGLLRSWFRQASSHRATAPEQAVVMHELGHVLGLAHVRDRAQIMYPREQGHAEYGAGDLAGLAKLGAGKCGD